MANQTVTSTLNYDSASISGLLDGETVTINGGSVTVDADVRWNQQAAVFGPVTISATLGGSFLLDGTRVWEVPFSASTGNVPTQAALGSNGVTGGTSGATGELTRVWATGSLTPATAGGAMPATGWIKLRSKAGDFVNGETITLPGGATITASGPGKRSWIHVVGRGSATGNDGSRLTIPRLGTFSASGDWYELGTTNGADDQTFQFPVADMCPAIWIETAPASNVYEIWLCAGDRWSGTNGGAVATGDRRGQYFGCDAATGVITIASRTGNTAGLKPPSGCRVRIPNVIMSNGSPSNYSANILPSPINSRYSFVTTSAGAVAMDRVTCNWLVSTSSSLSVSIASSGVASTLFLANTGTTITLTDVGIGLVDTLVVTPVSIFGCYGGGTLTNVRAVRRVTAQNSNCFAIADAVNFALTNVRSDCFGNPTTNTQSSTLSNIVLTRVNDSTATNCSAVGGGGLVIGTCSRLTVSGFTYASRTIGTTQTADLTNAIGLGNGSRNITIAGYGPFDGLQNVHPHGSIIAVGSGNDDTVITDIGTVSSPFSHGTANPSAGLVSATSSVRLTVRRCYTTAARSAMLSIANSVQGFAADNVWGDATASLAIAGNDALVRGCRGTPTTSGQSAVYGTHWIDAWTGATTGQIVIACNEPTTASAGQCAATLGSGSGFTSAGSVAMTRVGDEIIWTMPYFCLGATGFANSAPTITGTNAANHTLQFQWDTGSGWNGTWLALTGANLAGVGAINPATGVKLRVRATVNTASTSNLLTYIRIDTVTNVTDQQTLYPLPGSLLTVSNLAANSRVKVTRVDTGALLTQDSTSGSTLTLDIPYSGAVRVEVRNASGSTSYRPWVTQVSVSTGTTTTVTALQEQD
jgi:hypothetical protein